MVAWLVLIYALLIAAGGVMGYRAGSTASLIAGVVAGLALAGASAAMLRDNYQTGWWVALVVALLLLGRFGLASYSKGFKLMPGGLVIIMSLIVLAALLMQRSPASR